MRAPSPDTNQPDSTPSVEDGPEVEFKMKGSRFIAQVFSADSEQIARAKLLKLQRRYHDATHHCWALRLKPSSTPIERAEDNGEPSGTAGLPILGSLQRAKLYDAMVVVTRYFGGTKLGRGGLVRAYGEAARQAVAKAPRRTIWHDAALQIDCAFEELGAVEAVLARAAHEIRRVQRKFSSTVELRVRIRRGAAIALQENLREATADRARLRWLETPEAGPR